MLRFCTREPNTSLTFSEVWEDYDAFKEDYDALMPGFAQNPSPLKANSIKTVYYLLYARYGNTPAAVSDVGQFKMQIFATIFSYGANWERKLEVQDALRSLTETDLMTGAKQIYNHAYNPNSAPATNTLEELTYINDQNTANHKKSKIEAYSILWNVLHAEATTEFINKFKKCFSNFVDKMSVPIYIDNEGD